VANLRIKRQAIRSHRELDRIDPVTIDGGTAAGSLEFGSELPSRP
jgi:hypothetical protein